MATPANDKRLADAKQLVARYRDGHELSTAELTRVVEAGLLSQLLAINDPDSAPLWPSKPTGSTENEEHRCQDPK